MKTCGAFCLPHSWFTFIGYSQDGSHNGYPTMVPIWTMNEYGHNCIDEFEGRVCEGTQANPDRDSWLWFPSEEHLIQFKLKFL